MSDPLTGWRVGRLPYLNVHPFHAGWEGAEPEWVVAPPRRLGALAAQGVLAAAPLASRDALALVARYRPLAELGIARRGAVRSVLLFSRVPMGALEGARVAVTAESRTSRALLRILLSRQAGVRHTRPAASSAEADAWLAIGDPALAARARSEWPVVTDLGEAWTAWTGLPFVYARWVVRRDVPPAAARRLAARLRASLARFAAPDPSALPPGVTPAEAAAYLRDFVYCLGPAELAGLRRFHEELVRHGLHHALAGGRRFGSAA